MIKWCFPWVSALLLLTSIALGKPDCIILGYSSVWRDNANPPIEYNFDGLTYLARAFIKPLPDGSVSVPDGYFNADLETLAHQHGCKLLLSIGGGGAKSAIWISIATHPENVQRFLTKLDELLGTNHYDGVDIDWEPADPTAAEWQSYVTLLKALRAHLPHAILTTALPTDEFSTRTLAWPEVIANVDYVNAMAYDYSGSWSGIAAHSTNLFPAGDYAGETGHSVKEGMDNLIKNHQVPPSKLLLGMNFWGYRFRVDHIGDKFKRNAPGVSDDLSYSQVLDLQETGFYQSLWDEKAAIPYLQRHGGGSIVCCENPESIRRKCEYARGLNCAGMMIWGLASDMTGTQTPLLDAVVQSYGGDRHAMGNDALRAEIVGLKQTIERDVQATRGSAHHETGDMPVVPPNLKDLSSEQLDSLLAKLQWREGIADDTLWQSQTNASHQQP